MSFIRKNAMMLKTLSILTKLHNTVYDNSSVDILVYGRTMKNKSYTIPYMIIVQWTYSTRTMKNKSYTIPYVIIVQ